MAKRAWSWDDVKKQTPSSRQTQGEAGEEALPLLDQVRAGFGEKEAPGYGQGASADASQGQSPPLNLSLINPGPGDIRGATMIAEAIREVAAAVRALTEVLRPTTEARLPTATTETASGGGQHGLDPCEPIKADAVVDPKTIAVEPAAPAKHGVSNDQSLPAAAPVADAIGQGRGLLAHTGAGRSPAIPPVAPEAAQGAHEGRLGRGAHHLPAPASFAVETGSHAATQRAAPEKPAPAAQERPPLEPGRKRRTRSDKGVPRPHRRKLVAPAVGEPAPQEPAPRASVARSKYRPASRHSQSEKAAIERAAENMRAGVPAELRDLVTKATQDRADYVSEILERNRRSGKGNVLSAEDRRELNAKFPLPVHGVAL